MDNIKTGINDFLNVLINSLDSNTTQTIKTDLFTVQIGIQNKENEKELNKEAVANNMAIGDFSNCEALLKIYYNLTNIPSLLIKKVEFDPSTDVNKSNDTNASNGVTFEFFNPINKEKLNSTICNTVPTPLKIPFKQSYRLKMGLYTTAVVLKDVIDIYNSKTPGYHSRCYTSKEFESGADTSINYRRTKLFQNTSMECSQGCEYNGLDENKYVICNCSISGQEEISNSAEDGPLIAFPALNFDIALCYYETYTKVICSYNIFLV